VNAAPPQAPTEGLFQQTQAIALRTGIVGEIATQQLFQNSWVCKYLFGFFFREFAMIGMTENGFEQRWQPSRAIQAERGAVSLEERLEQATPIKEQLDSVRSWRERLSPKFRRAFSAGQLLFQVVGAAGYAGYFASMHTLMRLLSGALMAGTWYAIYRIKGAAQP
jgi:hypothetical protein